MSFAYTGGQAGAGRKKYEWMGRVLFDWPSENWWACNMTAYDP